MKKLLIIGMAITILSCDRTEKPSVPDNLLSKEKMVEVLYDVYILNAAKGASKTVLEKNGIFPEDYVFKKHNIDSLQFAESNAYYGFYVEEYESILSRLEQKIDADRVTYQALIDQEVEDRKRRQDSIKNAVVDTLTVKKKPKPENRVNYKDYPKD